MDGKRSECVATYELARHLGLEDKDAMKVVSLLREKRLVGLRERRSKSLIGCGYDGSLFSALTPSAQSMERARGYLRMDK